MTQNARIDFKTMGCLLETGYFIGNWINGY